MMGTNYYLCTDPCAHCGRVDEPLHIGKSSIGWCFALHVTDEIKTLHDWQAAWAQPGTHIEDEYRHVITPDEMLLIITQRGRDKRLPWSPWEFDRNHAIAGPRNLARHRLGRDCIGHGEGTWDYLAGEFS